jgi:hypothetical protein
MREEAARSRRAAERRRTWVAEVLRGGHAQSRPPKVTHLSSGERMALVWELLLDCYAWSTFNEDELRLQRSVGRVERRQR